MDTVSWYNCRDDRFRRREDDVEEDCSSLSVVVVDDDAEPSILVDAPIPIIATREKLHIICNLYYYVCG